jgi:hypothetical protein
MRSLSCSPSRTAPPGRRRIVALALAAVLSACGGGGSDSGGRDGGFQPQPGLEFNPLAAWSNLLLAGGRWEVSGIGSDSLLYSITITAAGAVGGGLAQPILGFPVPGFTAAVSQTQVSTAAGGIVRNVFQQTFFDPATLHILGLSSQVDGGFVNCDVALTASVPPTVATLGSSGQLAVLDERLGCGLNAESVGRLDVSWSLEFDDVTGANLFCVHSVERSLAGLARSSESDCIEVAPDGTLGSRALVSVSADGFELVAD